MEIIEFEEIVNMADISSVAILKQREKLNPNAFIYLMQNSLKLFYQLCCDVPLLPCQCFQNAAAYGSVFSGIGLFACGRPENFMLY